MTRTLILLILAASLLAACGGSAVGNAGTLIPRSPLSGEETPGPSLPNDTGDRSSPPSLPPTTEPEPEPTDAPTSDPTAGPPTSRPSAVPTVAPSAEPTPPSPTKTLPMKVYFLLDDPTGAQNPTLVPAARNVESTVAVAGAAMRELLAGPTADEAAGGVASAVPDGTLLLGINIVDGLATIDLSREFESGGGSFSVGARLAQVVYTMTQFSTVERVEFRLDGEPVTVFSGEGLVLDGPVTRDDYVDFLPPVFVDSPAYGDFRCCLDSVQVSGKANVFEASFFVGIMEGGEMVTEQVVQATCGTGCWGDFSTEIEYQTSQRPFTLVTWVASARDGNPENIREYPLNP
ncbi:MAG: GerMN domain-containing protein [Chloroflexi bacterium]|nr:GerMN domain-containing protein [Chloroflexota bacterium]